MCIGPQYKVNRLIERLQAERTAAFERVTGKGNRKLSGDRRFQLWNKINTLDWCIEQVRQAADRTGVRRKAA